LFVCRPKSKTVFAPRKERRAATIVAAREDSANLLQYRLFDVRCSATTNHPKSKTVFAPPRKERRAATIVAAKMS
jgi:hypothetical protein